MSSTITTFFNQQANSIIGSIIASIIFIILVIFSKKFRNLISWLWKYFYYSILNNVSFRITNMSKSVTAYKNGHGIISQDIELEIINRTKMKTFKRMLYISDAPAQCKFKQLKNMRKTKINDRFSQLGFWYKSDSEGVISSVEQVFEESSETRIVFNFIFEEGHLAKYKANHIKLSYGFSIPKLYPITDGKFDMSLLREGHQRSVISSNFSVNYDKMKFYQCTLGFEDGISFVNINSKYFPKGKDQNYKDIDSVLVNDLFYRKYKVYKKKPKLGSIIATECKIDS
jgi:hypothetical protein